MKKYILAVLFISLFTSPICFAGTEWDTTNTVQGSSAGLTVSKLVYTLTSVAGEDVELTLPNFGALQKVSLQIPASAPPTTGFTVELLSSASATAADLFRTEGAALGLTEDVDLFPRDTYGGSYFLSLVGGGYKLVASDLGAGGTLTVILWLWR